MVADMSLHCPNCGECLDEADTHLGDRCCAYCGTRSGLRACVLAPSREDEQSPPLRQTPSGVVLTEDGMGFRIELTRYDPLASVVLWLVSAALLVGALVFFGNRTLASGDFWICFAIELFFVGGAVFAALWLTFGMDIIVGDGEHWVLSSGFRRVAWRRRMLRADVRSVVLERRVLCDDRPVIGFAVRFVLADGTSREFGRGQDYKRLAWLVRYLGRGFPGAP